MAANPFRVCIHAFNSDYSRHTCPCSQPTNAVDLSIMPDLGDDVL